VRGRFYLLCFASMAAGILAQRYLHVALFFVCLGALAVVGALIAILGKWRDALVVMLPVAFAILGMVLILVSNHALKSGLLLEIAQKNAVGNARGRVLSDWKESGENSSFFIEVAEIQALGQAWSLRERLCVTVPGRMPKREIYPGVNVEIRGRVATPAGNRQWLADHGAACVMRAERRDIHVCAPAANVIARSVAGARRWMSSAYRRIFNSRLAGFIEGVSLSKTDGMDPTIIADLRACGLSHIVAVSGLHVSSAAMIALAAMMALGVGKRTRLIVACVMALLVLALSNFRPSAVRATIMAVACFGGMLLGRRYDSLAGLSIAGIAMLCVNPGGLADPGFQYSFAAALSIVLFLSRRKDGGEVGKARLALAVCAGAQLGVLPLTLARGEPAPVLAIVANLLAIWLVGALLLSSWSVAIISTVSLPLARAVAVVPSGIARWILTVASSCAHVPGAGLFVSALSTVALALYVASLVMFARGRAGRSLFKPFMALGLSILLVLACCFPVLPKTSHTSVIVFDVGEGDATVLRSSSGAIVLVDGGPEPGQVMRKLRERGISRIDLMVSTHPHADHYTGLVEVLRRMPVGTLLDADAQGFETGSYRELLEAASARNVPVTTAREGMMITVAPDMKMEILYCASCLKSPPENLNDCSIVAMAYVDGARLLLCGDIESEGQETLLSRHPSIECDVIKIPHHGAAEAVGSELLNASRPRLATISVGRDNKFGHPSQKCLSLLASRGIAIARTDSSGDIEIFVRNGKIGLNSKRR